MGAVSSCDRIRRLPTDAAASSLAAASVELAGAFLGSGYKGSLVARLDALAAAPTYAIQSRDKPAPYESWH